MGLKGMVIGRQSQSSQALSDFTSSAIRFPGTAPGSSPSFIDRAMTGGSIAAGYIGLRKNNTLAGRNAARLFNNEPEVRSSTSRLSMVSRLRKKERFMIWRSVFSDISRYFMNGIMRISYGTFFGYNDIAASAVRFRNR